MVLDLVDDASCYVVAVHRPVARRLAVELALHHQHDPPQRAMTSVSRSAPAFVVCASHPIGRRSSAQCSWSLVGVIRGSNTAGLLVKAAVGLPSGVPRPRYLGQSLVSAPGGVKSLLMLVATVHLVAAGVAAPRGHPKILAAVETGRRPSCFSSRLLRGRVSGPGDHEAVT